MPKEAIVRKIEQMRKQPENVRIKYVLVSVTISMTFVVVLWIFAIQDNVRKLINSDNPLSNSELFAPDEQQTLQDILQSAKNATPEPQTLRQAPVQAPQFDADIQSDAQSGQSNYTDPRDSVGSEGATVN